MTGEAPDAASLGRMRRVSNALNLRDNDALWSVLAVLNKAGLNALAERVANRIARTVGNRVVGAFSVAARDQRDRLE